MLNEYKQESLRDLITRSITSNNISKVTNSALSAIKKELQSSDKNTKKHAVLKLLFFHLQNFDIKWANLNTMEIITTCGIKGKRIGYLLAQLQFKSNHDWILMLPNLLRKDLLSKDACVATLALDLVNHVMTAGFASEVCKDLEKLLNLNNLQIRKKLVIALTKAAESMLKANLNVEFWDDLLIKLVSLLNSLAKEKEPSAGLAICIISCVQKVCKTYPQKTLPVFLELMNYFSKCEINWNIIKLIDVFADLLKLEPRLAKKKEFVKLISDKLALTRSKSVEIQLVKLVITNYDSGSNNPSGPSGNAISELFANCEERLKNLLKFVDNNLVLVALRILKDLFKKNKVLSRNYLNDVIKILENCECRSIQAECLDIIYLCVDKSNYKEIVAKLLGVVPTLGCKAISTVLNVCTHESYSRLEKKEDFVWFLNILFDLGKNEFVKNEIENFNGSGGNNGNSDNFNNGNCGANGNSNGKSEENDEMRIAYVLRDVAQRIESLREIVMQSSLDLAISLFAKLKSFGSNNGNQMKINMFNFF